MASLRAELGDLEGFPNVIADAAMGAVLTYAIYHSPIELIVELLDTGADPNWPADDGFPPLIAALSCAQPAPGAPARTDVHAIVEALLSHGADAWQRGVNDFTPLHLAASQGDIGAVDLLLDHGADPNAITRIDEFETALDVAQGGGHRAVVDRLRPLTIGLDWERAARAGDIDQLKRMARAGHDINSRDRHGQTALMHAAHAGDVAIVEWLIGKGAELDHTAKFHLSALMLAVISGNHRIARLLVRAGADTTINGFGAPGFYDKTAADLAEERGDQRLAAYLRTR